MPPTPQAIAALPKHGVPRDQLNNYYLHLGSYASQKGAGDSASTITHNDAGNSASQIGHGFEERGDPQSAIAWHLCDVMHQRDGGSKCIPDLATTFHRLGACHSALGARDVALGMYAQQLALATQCGDVEKQQQAHVNIANVRLDIADALAPDGASGRGGDTMRDELTRAMIERASECERHAAARSHAQSLRLARELGRGEETAKAYVNLVVAYDALGEPRRALGCALAGLSMPGLAQLSARTRALLLMHAGQQCVQLLIWDETDALCVPAPSCAAACAGPASGGPLRRERVRGALAYLVGASQTASKSSDAPLMWDTEIAIVKAHSQRGDYAAASRVARNIERLRSKRGIDDGRRSALAEMIAEIDDAERRLADAREQRARLERRAAKVAPTARGAEDGAAAVVAVQDGLIALAKTLAQLVDTKAAQACARAAMATHGIRLRDGLPAPAADDAACSISWLRRAAALYQDMAEVRKEAKDHRAEREYLLGAAAHLDAALRRARAEGGGSAPAELLRDGAVVHELLGECYSALASGSAGEKRAKYKFEGAKQYDQAAKSIDAYAACAGADADLVAERRVDLADFREVEWRWIAEELGSAAGAAFSAAFGISTADAASRAAHCLDRLRRMCKAHGAPPPPDAPTAAPPADRLPGVPAPSAPPQPPASQPTGARSSHPKRPREAAEAAAAARRPPLARLAVASQRADASGRGSAGRAAEKTVEEAEARDDEEDDDDDDDEEEEVVEEGEGEGGAENGDEEAAAEVVVVALGRRHSLGVTRGGSLARDARGGVDASGCDNRTVGALLARVSAWLSAEHAIRLVEPYVRTCRSDRPLPERTLLSDLFGLGMRATCVRLELGCTRAEFTRTLRDAYMLQCNFRRVAPDTAVLHAVWSVDRAGEDGDGDGALKLSLAGVGAEQLAPLLEASAAAAASLLRHVAICDGAVRSRGVGALCQLLPPRSALARLDLRAAQLCAAAVDALVGAAARGALGALVELELGHNPLGDTPRVAALLRAGHGWPLRAVGLADCLLGADAAHALGGVLADAPARDVDALDLRANPVPHADRLTLRDAWVAAGKPVYGVALGSAPFGHDGPPQQPPARDDPNE